jgi:CBS domain-containing protein
MNAADVMVTKVISVGPDICVQEAAKVMLTNGISAVPVVGKDGTLLGIVSEGDLVRRAEVGTGRHRPWWLAMLTGKEVLADEYVREHSRKVTDIMTRKVVTASPDMPLAKVADLLEKNAIKRVPIVKDGRIVGIVSRANLVQALAAFDKGIDAATGASDEAIRTNVVARLDAEPWTRPALINVIVRNGTVDLRGIVDSVSEKRAARVAVEVTPGVRAVNDNLIIRPAESGY